MRWAQAGGERARATQAIASARGGREVQRHVTAVLPRSAASRLLPSLHGYLVRDAAARLSPCATYLSARARSARLAFDSGNFAGLHQAFEALKVVGDLLLGLLAEHGGNPAPDAAGRRNVVEHNLHLRPPIHGRRDETHRAGVVHLRAAERAPRDELVRLIVDDLGVPLDGRAGRARRGPVAALLVQHLHGLHVLHEARQVVQVAPEAIQLLRRLVDRDALLDVNAVL